MKLSSSTASALLLIALAGIPAHTAEPATDEAQRILGEAERDASAIDRARDRLEAELRSRGFAAVDPSLLIELSRAWYLHGELRAETDDARAASFDRGRTVGEKAVDRAPNDPYAHFWYATNLGRWAEERGVVRSILELSTVKAEVAETLRLAPDLPDAHVFAGNLARHLPRFMGGDEVRAEVHLRRAVALDPHRTRFRLELAELLIDSGRLDEARVELRGVLAEAAPSDRIFTALYDRPRAVTRLAELDAAAR